jgi:hypothetical protein
MIVSAERICPYYISYEGIIYGYRRPYCRCVYELLLMMGV